MSRKIKHTREYTAKRYAVKLLVDMKEEVLFGEELDQYIRASVMHDTGKSYHTQAFYDLCEEAIMDLYEKYVIQCDCCKKYVHIDMTRKYREKRYCKSCISKRKKK